MPASVIQSVEPVRLRIPFTEIPPPPEGVGEPSTTYEILLVRVETSDGLVGWGESWSLSMADATEITIKNVVAPLCIGQDASAIGPLSRLVKKSLGNARVGPLTYALSGVDIALWDILGKAADKPLHALIGGAYHEKLEAYASLVRYSDPALVAEKCREAVSQGYRHLKLHEITVEAVAAAREAVGPDVTIRLDPAWAWTPSQAVDMVKRFAPYDMLWVEEPVYPPEDVRGIARVRAEGGLPIAAGENAVSVYDSIDLIETGGVSYIQPSVIKIGGVTEALRIRNVAETHSVAFCPHVYFLGTGLPASVHLSAASPETTAFERAYYFLEADMFNGAFDPVDGKLVVPAGPGLGCDPDPDVIKDYRVRD